jgi:hypothetical protein
MPPLMVRASPELVLVKKTAAVEASSERRDIRAGEKASIIAVFRNSVSWRLHRDSTG